MKAIKRLWFKICQTVKWLPIIWKNAHYYDYDFLLQLMIAKLQEMENFFNSSDAQALDAKDIVKEIRAFRLALIRISEDDYWNGRDNSVMEADALRTNDIEFASNLFKKVVCWWD